MLSGETDIATVAELSELVTAQLAGGTVHLTIDVSGLSFADSASVRVLVLAARTLKERGGGLVDHPGNLGGSDTWEDSGPWRHSGSIRRSCVNAR